LLDPAALEGRQQIGRAAHIRAGEFSTTVFIDAVASLSTAIS
jgi:hypothetical protein